MHGVGLIFFLWGCLAVAIPILLLMGWFIKEKGFYAISLLFVLLGIAWFEIMVEIEKMEQNIKDKSIERFGIEPEYIQINFDAFFAGSGKPHAIVRKDGQVYYWSFGRDDFVFYYTYGKEGWDESTLESIDKLLNQYIFNKEENK